MTAADEGRRRIFRPEADRVLRWFFTVLGLGVIAAGLLALIIVALLLGPLLVWLSWNVLDLAHAVGANELGFWGIVLFAVFLAIGFIGRVLIVGVVFLIDPDWLHSGGAIHWPEPTFRNFVAIVLLLLVASASGHAPGQGRRTKRQPAGTNAPIGGTNGPAGAGAYIEADN